MGGSVKSPPRPPLSMLVCFLLVVSPAFADSDLRLPKVFTDHMVLQRGMQLPVWGWARGGATVTVTVAGARASAVANVAGEWKATLPALEAGGPFEMRVEGSGSLTFKDLLVGEVWLCSGQSNMEMGIGACRDGKAEIAAADHPRIRLLMVPNRFSAMPQADIDAAWRVCTPAAVAEGGWGGFSGAAYCFGREIHNALGVPVGLIDATWGGTVIQSWTPPEGFAALPALQGEYERAPRPPRDVQGATALHNGMIRPLRPFGLRGAIWYQGESNLADGALYTERMKALVGGWREIWGQGEFPFYFVQIAPFKYGGDPQALPLFWEAQAAAQAIPQCGMVVTNDIGDLADIHPANKQEVGRRLALWALAKTYGKSVLCSGPTVRSAAAEGAKFRVTFDNAGTGLASRDGKPLRGFEIIDADAGGFVAAEAEIVGSSVLLSAPGVSRPVAVRFAWQLLAEPNLVNSAGLPAGAFRAGTAPSRGMLAMGFPGAEEQAPVCERSSACSVRRLSASSAELRDPAGARGTEGCVRPSPAAEDCCEAAALARFRAPHEGSTRICAGSAKSAG